MAEQDTTIPVPDRLGKIESVLEKVLGFMDAAAPVLGMVPGAAPVIAGVEAVGHVADELMHAADGSGAVDSAALAAGQISRSTGDSALDARLAAIEALLYAAIPVVKLVAKQFGHDTPELAVPAVAGA